MTLERIQKFVQLPQMRWRRSRSALDLALCWTMEGIVVVVVVVGEQQTEVGPTDIDPLTFDGVYGDENCHHPRYQFGCSTQSRRSR